MFDHGHPRPGNAATDGGMKLRPHRSNIRNRNLVSADDVCPSDLRLRPQLFNQCGRLDTYPANLAVRRKAC
jgi:hypothetical protein